ncbi:MAG: 3-hydroxyacyl-CoA dehydrogenase NAD-binding domain-containing protein, partial [Candidatus Eremiobacteraeota bacterium]|nr:3-hydroxyacyl-CoA dehydrogenase NAD-binding domain-containing protein [Candidatus Eremiobacteraeota bacterium]
MGSGIAQVAAAAGNSVILHDRDEQFIQRGISSIERNLARSVEKGRLTETQRGTILSHITTQTALKDFDVDIAIEAATENLQLKLELFAALDAATPPQAILASNT